MNTYKVLLPLVVHTKDGSYKQGDTFENEFTEFEETANLANGLLEIVPRTYKVIGGSRVHEANPGDTFEAGLPLGQERLLIEGGHIERVEKAPPKRAKKEVSE